MRVVGRKAWPFLLGVLLLVGYGAYELGVYCWGFYHYRSAETALARRDFREAGVHLNQALAAWPRDDAVRLLAAQTARRRGDYDEAIRHLKVYERRRGPAKELELEYQLWPMLAGDLHEADSLLASCNPDAPEWPLIAEACIEGTFRAKTARCAAGGSVPPEVERALRVADQWLRCQTGSADQVQGLVWRGRLHSLANDHTQAVADLRQAVALDPAHFDARWHLAMTVAQEAPEEAVTHFEILQRSRPESRQVRLVLAITRRGLGQLAEAERMLDEILEAEPDNLLAVLERGKAALDGPEPATAERWLRRAEASAPNHPEVLLALSRLLLLTGRPDEAKQYRERFLQAERQQQHRPDEFARKVTPAG